MMCPLELCSKNHVKIREVLGVYFLIINEARVKIDLFRLATSCFMLATSCFRLATSCFRLATQLQLQLIFSCTLLRN